VLEKAQMRMLPLANRANDLGPAALVCCNACRSCVTTNIVGLGMAAIGGLAVSARRFARGFAKSAH
jgi:hypothetical protein